VSLDVDQRAAAVALARQLGLDGPRTAELIESAADTSGPLEMLRGELGAGASLLPEDPAPLLAQARDDIARWQANGQCVLTIVCDGYPGSLRTVHDRPALVFVAGDAELVRAPDAVAVVGTRHPSEDGLAAATEIATDLARAGCTVVSGLAAGIDAAAHRAAIAAGGRTVAVIGTGLEHAYPPINAALQAQLARDHAVLSPFWPGAPPHAARFRRRNAVMSGLSLGTMIVQASARSGTRVQARLALAHGRPVFLLAPLLAQGWAAELARRPGVHVVESAAEALAIARRRLDAAPLLDGAPGDPHRE
jgi:DNA processing protein